MADCEVEGTIASPLASPRGAMSPTGERRDERRNIRTRQNPFGPQEADAHRLSMIEHVTGPSAPNSSKKYRPRIKDAENPHHTVTFGECSGTCKVECGLSVSQIRQL
ncbi:hypothetical protein TNCV_2936931 [Trichonephila clavipes]|nr:hypothetical protein TNCV_2936931 [Trichonephila clavipes]